MNVSVINRDKLQGTDLNDNKYVNLVSEDGKVNLSIIIYPNDDVVVVARSGRMSVVCDRAYPAIKVEKV